MIRGCVTHMSLLMTVAPKSQCIGKYICLILMRKIDPGLRRETPDNQIVPPVPTLVGNVGLAIVSFA